jgi:hypothetical protein
VADGLVSNLFCWPLHCGRNVKQHIRPPLSFASPPLGCS